jgi:ribosomal protein S18 acetylase RimI-like enzyme
MRDCFDESLISLRKVNMMETAITIREATTSDVPTIVDLYTVLYHDDGRLRDHSLDPAWASAHGAAYFQTVVTDSSSTCFLAEHGQESVGYLLARFHDVSDFRRVALAELESMVVRPAWRRQGVGRALAQAFIDWARQRHAAQLRVTAYASNHDAIAFYRSLGFTPHQVTLQQTLT